LRTIEPLATATTVADGVSAAFASVALAPEWHPEKVRVDARMIENGKIEHGSFRMWVYTFS
jgi:hypothetical protein